MQDYLDKARLGKADLHLCNNPDCGAFADDQHVPLLTESASLAEQAKHEYDRLPEEEKKEVKRKWDEMSEEERQEIRDEVEFDLL